MRKPVLIAAVLLLAAASVGSLAAQNGYDQFQKALAKERSEGNLAEAIALYQKVIDGTKDEALAAQAQLRIGICYEKLGQEKAKLAQEAFQKVVDKYPSQTETVKTAKEKLTLLLRAQSGTGKEDGGLNMRFLLRGQEAEAQVSPDGRLVAYFDYDEGAMAVHDLSTGKNRPLKSTLKNEGNGECWSFCWSARGDALVCSWWQWLGPSGEYVGRWTDLRIVPVNNSGPRILVRGDFDDAYVYDWSPDGDDILASFYGQRPIMALVSSQDGVLRKLKTFPRGQFIPNMELSPDGRFIVYDDFQEESNTRRDLFIFALDKGVDTPLVRHPAHDSFLGWSPDGERVLFLSDRTGTFDLWALPMKEGKARGEPLLLKRGIGDIRSAGVGQNSSLFYTVSTRMQDVYTAELDPLSGKIKGPLDKIAFSKEGNNSWPQYSPDGRMIVCEHGGDSARGEGENALYVRSLETGEERVFPLKTWAIGPRWTPDGRFIYFSDARRGLIFRLELATGLIADVKSGQSAPNYFVDTSPDDRSIYYVHSNPMGAGEELCQLIKRDVRTGLETELYRMNVRLPFIVSLSPDGKRLAIVSREEQRAIQIVPSSGGQVQDIYRFKHSGGHPTWLDWTPDGRSIIFTKRNEKNEGPGWGLWRLSVDGGEPESLGISPQRYIEEVCLHPGGKRLALSTSTNGGPELWVMENFLPGNETKAKGGRK